jgi:DNA-binding GntR family transcriptional regulator
MNSKNTVVDQITDHIRDGIKHGRFAPGQRLVEADLTRELSVSRGPLREGLSRLASEGHLVIEPFRGAVVRRWTRQDIVDLFGVREVLEGQAAHLAATSGAAVGRKALLSAVKKVRRDVDPQGYMVHNTSFHEDIARLSGNALLQRLLDQLSTNAYRLQFRQVVIHADRRRPLADHLAIAEAIALGDGKAAERAMRRHVRESLEQTLSLFDAALL